MPAKKYEHPVKMRLLLEKSMDEEIDRARFAVSPNPSKTEWIQEACAEKLKGSGRKGAVAI